MTPRIALIAAIGSNGVIGAANGIPWYLPSDFAHFKRTTMGKPLIMGRRTFESIGRPLPGRTSIVVTRQPDFRPDGVRVAGSLEAALSAAAEIASAAGVGEIVIGGGGTIYRAAMELADRLYITHVDAAPAGDVTFPAIDPAVWRVVDTPVLAADSRDTATCRVKVYERQNPGQR